MEIKLNLNSKILPWLAWPITGPWLLVKGLMVYKEAMWFTVAVLSLALGIVFPVVLGTNGHWILMAITIWLIGGLVGYSAYRWFLEL